MIEYAQDTSLSRKMSHIQDEAAHRADCTLEHIAFTEECVEASYASLLRIEGHLAAIAEFLKAKA